MPRCIWAGLALVPAMMMGTAFGQQPAAAPAAAENEVRPPLLFRETWKQPPYTGKLNDQNRRATQAAVGNPNLELKLYGAAAKELGVYVHEGRQDLWNGMVTSPMAGTCATKTATST